MPKVQPIRRLMERPRTPRPAAPNLPIASATFAFGYLALRYSSTAEATTRSTSPNILNPLLDKACSPLRKGSQYRCYLRPTSRPDR